MTPYPVKPLVAAPSNMHSVNGAAAPLALKCISFQWPEKAALGGLRVPSDENLNTRINQMLCIKNPGGVGSILKDPDGAAWLRGEIQHQQPDIQTMRIVHANVKPAQPML
jgi:hypothetical protein